MSSGEGLLDAIREADARLALFEPGDRVVVGVSGGPDSVALLDALRAYAPLRSLQLHVAHLDHMLRQSGVADAAWVQQLAADWGLPATVHARDVGRLAARLGLSLENAARQARYAFLARVAAEQGARGVAVGHQADDQVETVLMHFLRGAGLDGLSGMQTISDYPLDAAAIAAIEDFRAPAGRPWPPRLLRPLLEVPRRAITAHLRETGIEARRDESNEDPAFLRNRIRLEVLPLLEEINPRLRDTLRRNAQAVGGDLDYVRRAVDRAWTEGVDAGPDRVHLPLAGWRGLHPAIQRRLLRRAAAHLGTNARDLGLDSVEAARAAIEAGATLNLPGGLRLHSTETGFDLSRGGPAIPPPLPETEARSLRVPGQTDWPGGWRLEAELRERRPGEPAAGRDPWQLRLDADRLVGPLTLRAREPGDRLQPLGMGGQHKSLQDLFVDAKIPRQVREGWPLLFDAQRLIWVPGLRVDERVRLGPGARRLLVLRCQPPPDVER